MLKTPKKDPCAAIQVPPSVERPVASLHSVRKGGKAARRLDFSTFDLADDTNTSKTDPK